MIDSLMAAFAGVITSIISAMGYAGIALLMAIESACIPLPSEIIMPFSGYLVYTGRFDLWMVALAGAIGCNIGSTAAYLIGASGGRPAIERWGRYIWLDSKSVDRAEHYFQTYGSLTVFVARLLPVVRTFISLPAGIARMPFVKFQIYTFLGSLPWCFALAWIGMRLGESWDSSPTLRAVMHILDAVVVLALAIAAVWYVHRQIRERIR